jgi:hypothetical protein
MEIACDMTSFTAAERAAHAELSKRLLGVVVARKRVDGGYSFALGGDISLAEVGTWVERESKCCPFLNFEIKFTRGATGQRALELALTGPPGTPELLEAELGLS